MHHLHGDLVRALDVGNLLHVYMAASELEGWRGCQIWLQAQSSPADAVSLYAMLEGR